MSFDLPIWSVHVTIFSKEPEPDDPDSAQADRLHVSNITNYSISAN
jgi:hypothetical protein